MDKANKAVFDANAQCCDIMNNLVKEKTIEKIDITKILKDCPTGMELDCTIFEDVYFDYVDELNIIHCYIQHETHKTSITFNQHGTPNSDIKSKCVIFPKGKTTWEGFVPPCKFKDGNIAISDKGDIHLLRTKDSSYCAYRERWERVSKLDETITTSVRVVRLATEEEKKKLFNSIKENGYKWNAETKTLEKLPKFKVGDRIKNKTDKWLANRTIRSYDKNIGYFTTMNDWVRIEDQDNYELVPDKFDINILVPFESRVLIRDNVKEKWYPGIWGCYDNDTGSTYPYKLIGVIARYCIPYEGNEHLLGTTNDCDKYFKSWE